MAVLGRRTHLLSVCMVSQSFGSITSDSLGRVMIVGNARDRFGKCHPAEEVSADQAEPEQEGGGGSGQHVEYFQMT